MVATKIGGTRFYVFMFELGMTDHTFTANDIGSSKNASARAPSRYDQSLFDRL